jgi:hypothetical protein
MALLAGCDSGVTRFPIACPKPAILAEGADLTRYRPGAPTDLTGLESDARLVRVEGECGRGQGGVDVQLAVGFVIDRGPASHSRTVDLPWFVAVVDNRDQQVLSERSFVDRIMFNPNETRASRLSQQVEVSLPVGEGRRPQDYTIYVSFRLTPEQLAFNRRRGVR